MYPHREQIVFLCHSSVVRELHFLFSVLPGLFLNVNIKTKNTQATWYIQIWRPATHILEHIAPGSVSCSYTEEEKTATSAGPFPLNNYHVYLLMAILGSWNHPPPCDRQSALQTWPFELPDWKTKSGNGREAAATNVSSWKGTCENCTESNCLWKDLL